MPNAAGPMIAANPSSLSYGSVGVGTTSTQQITISNSGDQTLSGSITTPAGYTISLVAREEAVVIGQSNANRNTLPFTVNAGSNKVFNLVFAPTAATNYNGNVVITTNAVNSPTVNVAVTGSGFVPPTIAIDNDFLGASLLTGEDSSDGFSISNTGSQTLNYTIGLQEIRFRGTRPLLTSNSDANDRSIAGSTLNVNATEYLPGTTVDWTFTVYNASTDTEWLKDIYITFPAGITVNSVGNFTGGSADMIPNQTNGNGITVQWHGETTSGWGVIQGGQTGVAVVNVTIPAGFGGPIALPFQLDGDVYGAEPHMLTGELSIAQGTPPIEWFSVIPMSGSVAPGGNQSITGYFSAAGMEAGIYEAMLTIYSNDPANPNVYVSVMMEVTGTINHAPVINIPATFDFEKNGSLIVDFTSYVSDPDNDPLILQYSGNSNVLVQVNGMNVTFTATQNWIGTENITFTVTDGIALASDIVAVTVNPVNMPSWQPVVYPNNPATIYGTVTIEGIPAQPNDIVGAFCGDECRGIGEVVMNGGVAYVTILINLSGNRETITLKVYSYATDMVYPVAEYYNLGFGEVLGDDTPLPIDAGAITYLDSPVVNTLMDAQGFVLQWLAVPNAESYQVFRSSDPYGTFTLIATVTNTQYIDSSRPDKAFYYIKALRGNPAK